MIILTHFDFDGVTAAIIGKVCFPDAKVEFCNYDNINEKVLDYITNEDYLGEVIYITDISVNEKIAETIEFVNSKELKERYIKLFDHHKTAKWLDKYEWVCFDDNKCGAKVFYDWLWNIHSGIYRKRLEPYKNLVCFANDYDLWIHKYPHSKRLNMLIYEYGLERFMKRFLKNNNCDLTETEELLLELAEERKQKHIENMKKNMLIYKNQNDENIAVFLSTKFAGEVRDYINDDNIDYYMFFDIVNGICSIRCKDGKDCTIIAKRFNGGGHKGAAGFQFKFDIDRFLKQFSLIK